MIAFVWQFEVKNGKQAEFERFFGADGAWTAMGRRSRSYLGSSFLRDQVEATRYLLIDYWSEAVVYERHLKNFTEEIAGLERQRDELLTSWQALGVFTALDVPDRFGPTWSRRSG